jgi:DNA modification methylase
MPSRSAAPPEVRIITMRVADLKPAPYNPRRIDPAAMAGLTKSVERFGMVQPVVFNTRSNLVVGGHQRLKVLRATGAADTPVVVVDLDPIEERALNVALNSGAISGDFTDALQPLLLEIQSAADQLFTDLRLGALFEAVEPRTLGAEADDAPEVPAEAFSKLGDVWTLGRHRLVCGDSTDPATVRALLGGERVDILCTDPPYGVAYGEKTELMRSLNGTGIAHRPIENDSGIDYRTFFGAFLRPIPWANYATFYVFMSGTELHHLREAIDDVGYKWGAYLAWVKSQMVFSMRKDYSAGHEWIVYGWPKRHRFYGPPNRVTVLEFDRPRKSELHPTMKPVALLTQLLADGSTDGAIVYDAFGGSGSTLIACENSRRQARVCELDPLYTDVCAQRWTSLTGQPALLNGEPQDVITPKPTASV